MYDVIMKIIELTKKKVAIVDDADFEYLNQWKWHISSKGYAIRREHLSGGHGNEKFRFVLLHRQLMTPSDKQQVDHLNGDKLDNRKANLRLCTPGENQSNRGLQSNNTSGYKGVFAYGTRWRARIVTGRKNINLGVFDTKEQAALAYNEAALIHHGTFAKLNKVLTPTVNTTRNLAV